MKDVIATSWTKQDGYWVAWNGQTRIMNGWVLYKDELYYIKDGFMLADGEYTIDGHDYLFKRDGIPVTRWAKRNGRWYYYHFDDATKMKNAFILGRDGKIYYVNHDGIMLENVTADFAVNGELTYKGKPIIADYIINDADANI